MFRKLNKLLTTLRFIGHVHYQILDVAGVFVSYFGSFRAHPGVWFDCAGI